ncbi:MAG: 23S rRNA (guanosine(2251)-2'-O)-methyltransferase RlmB [Eubacterium sp.]|nr:23S rRNA (guanosine(2251)-2'-O)-methyltransferase RlmB [Eubacterium sp.]
MKKISLFVNNRGIFILNKRHYNVIIIKNILWRTIVKNEEKKDFRTNDNLVVGRNAVIELIKSGREIENILIAKGEREGSVSKIIALAKEKGIVIKNVDKKKLDFISANANHQGVAANVPAHGYSTVDEILELAESKGEAPFIIICDEIEDSHNLGAIIRTAEACGVHGIIIPKRRNVGLNFIVAKTSCGALEYVHVARVSNISSTIDRLKKENIWVYAADMDGQPWNETDFSGGVALVVGSEGKGVGEHIKKNCDVTVSLPMKGKVNSLNASVAAGIIMYEIVKQRL